MTPLLASPEVSGRGETKPVVVSLSPQRSGVASLIHVRGYKEQDNINTPLELAIRNQTDRFSLAIDASDRVPRLRDRAAHVREALLNQQISRMNHAFEFGVDPSEIMNWRWPF
jgi:xylulose-5-phosphate/fructose-6-phosphate phosphoketolase